MTVDYNYLIMTAMGTHQRDWAEQAEIDITAGLNGLPVNDSIQRIVNTIHTQIKKMYPNEVFKKAHWVGGDNYKDPGDVHVEFASGKKEKIELKISLAKGNGTAKNLGAKTFNKKVSKNIKGYLEFEQDYKQQRYDYLGSLISRKFNTASAYCIELRKQPDTVKDKIAIITAPGQEAYAKYAATELNNYLKEVNLLVNNILNVSGVEEPKQDILYCVVQSFNSKYQTEEFYDFADMDRTITKIEATGKSVKFYNAKGKDVIRFSVHWKNICQGGSTACFNVFIGNAYK